MTRLSLRLLKAVLNLFPLLVRYVLQTESDWRQIWSAPLRRGVPLILDDEAEELLEEAEEPLGEELKELVGPAQQQPELVLRCTN